MKKVIAMNGREEQMDDLIKRQDAITAYCEHECGIKGMTRENCGATDCGTIFDDIPSADVRENVQLDVCPLYGGACGYPSGECYDCPRHGNFRENVRGEWIFPYGDKKYKRCSVCGRVFYSIPYNTNFCPNCGADMRSKS